MRHKKNCKKFKRLKFVIKEQQARAWGIDNALLSGGKDESIYCR